MTVVPLRKDPGPSSSLSAPIKGRVAAPDLRPADTLAVQPTTVWNVENERGEGLEITPTQGGSRRDRLTFQKCCSFSSKIMVKVSYHQKPCMGIIHD